MQRIRFKTMNVKENLEGNQARVQPHLYCHTFLESIVRNWLCSSSILEGACDRREQHQRMNREDIAEALHESKEN